MENLAMPWTKNGHGYHVDSESIFYEAKETDMEI